MVEINAGDDSDVRIVWRRSAEDSDVVADIGSDPVSGEIERIREDRCFPGLESNVGRSEIRIRKFEARIYFHLLSAVAELVKVVQKLPLPDDADFRIGSSFTGECARRRARKEEEKEGDEGNKEWRLPLLPRHLIPS